MSLFGTIFNPEQGGEHYMQVDRTYFTEHPDEECYVREKFSNEPLPAPKKDAYVVVFNMGEGVRLRLPYDKPTLSIDDIRTLKLQHVPQFKALQKALNKKKHYKRDKSKGFSTKKNS